MSNCQTWMAIAEKREAELKAAREQLVHDSELCEGLAVDCKASRQLADRYKAALERLSEFPDCAADNDEGPCLKNCAKEIAKDALQSHTSARGEDAPSEEKRK